MKKTVIGGILAILMLVSFVPAISAAPSAVSDPITVLLNGNPVNFADQGPVIVDGRVLVPVRGVFEQMGFEVDWNEATSQATLTGHATVVITIGSNVFTTNGVSGTLDVPAQTKNARTMLPLRLVLESIGFNLNWIAETQTVQITASTLPIPQRSTADWSFGRFSNIRDVSFSTSLPHGGISVGFIEYMSDNLGGRSAFTYQEKEAAAWIVEELLAMGHAWDAIEVQEFSFQDSVEKELRFIPADWEHISSPSILGTGRNHQLRADRTSQNVILTVPGESERFIIVGAHYDSVPYPGASDNASGVALLLESAQRMLELDNYYTIVYVFFGAEEVGLLGAFYYYDSLLAAEHANVVMMINADVLIEGPYILFGAGMIPEIDEQAVEDIVSIFDEAARAYFRDIAVAMTGSEEIDEDILDELVYETIAGILGQLASMPPILAATQGFTLGVIEVVETGISRQIDAIAANLNRTDNLELLRLPEAVMFSTDHLVFGMTHTVLNMAGLERTENIDGQRIPMGVQVSPEFAATVLHSPMDEFNTIEYLWPGMMDANMRAFGLLLEAVLMASYS